MNYQRPHSTLAEPPQRCWRSAVFLLGHPVPKTRTLPLADRVRGRLLKGEASSTVTGRRAGVARTDGHQHLHILPEGQEQLDRVRLWSPEGFGRQDLALQAGLRTLPRDQGSRR